MAQYLNKGKKSFIFPQSTLSRRPEID